MPEEQILQLLQQSDAYFQKRDLKNALEIAGRALELAQSESFDQGVLKSNLLLGKIHITSGRFEADASHYPLALAFIEKANTLNQPPHQNGNSVEIFLAYGEVFQNRKEHTKASDYYEYALNYARKSSDTSNIVEALCALSNHYVLQKELSKAFDYVTEALDLLDGSMNSSVQCSVFNQLCQVYIKKQDYPRVLDYGTKALEISRDLGEIEQELNALNNIAVYYGAHADYKTAMEYFLEALEKSKAIAYRKNIAQVQINIATIYASLFNYQEAINRYQTVLKEFDDVVDDYTQVIVRNNLGTIYYHSGKPEQALEHFTEAFEMASRIHYYELLALTLAQKSRTYLALEQLEASLEVAQQAEHYFKDLGDVNGKQINLVNFGHIYFYKKEFDQAIDATSKGIELAKSLNDDENEIRGYQILAKVYQELKDFEKALHYQVIYSTSQEKFAKEQRSRQILDMEIQFAIREKQKEIEQLTKDNEYQALLLEQSEHIANQNVQLLQVNEELRQFAYVASHDLKEPLRMIGSYTQLIQRKFKDQSDEDSDLFFGFVSEGVTRMNNLLDALLKYATIGKHEIELETVDLNTVLEISLINLQVRIDETQTSIIVENQLPKLHAVQSLLIQLFQNLISNAIKFRKADDNPEIRIASREEADHFTISVNDNGIGIDPEFQERIFIIFQRLHTRAQYEGTGIGLSICQKIVQRLGGTISVQSQLGVGATFYFTIPKKIPEKS